MINKESSLIRHLLVKFSLLALIFSLSLTLKAQDVASLTGVVTDTSGAVIPGVNVTLINTLTGATSKATTNSLGSYSIINVAPGPGYKVTFTHDGFNPTTVNGMYLNVSSTRTQNASMQVGNVAQTIEVSANNQEDTLNTTDATVGNNFQVELVNELPVQIRDNPSQLFTLQPGTTVDGAVTGARTDQNHVTVDGLDVDDIATGTEFRVIANAPVDSIQEFRGEAAGTGSSTDSGGGGQYQLVTKSGTNTFHGSLFEYHRDTSTEANEWFNNDAGVGRGPLIRNQFGGNIGGPILKNKFFFFFEYNGRRDTLGQQISRTVPLDSFRNGNISYIKNTDASGNTCQATSRQNTTPQCIGSIDAAHVASLDPQGIGFDPGVINIINQRYPHANDLTRGDGINTGGFRFNAAAHFVENDYVARLDYSLNNSMKIWARASVVSQRQDDSLNHDIVQFPGDPVSFLRNDASYAYVIGHNWVIGSTKTNQFIYGETRARLNFPEPYNPQGDSQFNWGGNGTGGLILDGPYANVGDAQERVVPIPIVRDDFSWLKGSHNFQFGGFFKFIKTFENSVGDYYNPTIGLGGNMNSLNKSLRPTDIRTAGTTASNTYDSAFALALGHFASNSGNFDYDSNQNVLPPGTGTIHHHRYYEVEAYWGDTWRASPSLTLSYGVRYQWYSVPFDTEGIQSSQNFTFSQYYGDRLAQSTAGQYGNNSVPFITYVLGGKANNGPGLYKPSYKNFAPRFSFAYNPSFDRKTVFRGGAGIVYDHTIINAASGQANSYLFSSSSTVPYGVVGNPVTSLKNDPRFTSIQAPPPPPAAPGITIPYQPFVDNTGAPNGLANGSAFNSIIDPNFRNPYSIMLNFGLQHEFPKSFLLKMDYVGRLGRRLMAQADANQVIDFPDKASGQQLSAAFSNIINQVRAGADTTNLPAQPWFENVVNIVVPGVGIENGYPNNTSYIASGLANYVSNGDFADFVQQLAAAGLIPPNVGMGSQFSENTFFTNKGFSSYNGFLVTLHKNNSHGLQFDVNYTWSHSIDNVSLIANSSAQAGYGFICDAQRPKECRGNSDFDVTHYITGDALYDLPFGRGRTFGGNTPFWLNELIGGWQLSALPTWHSGKAFTTASNAFVAGYANDAPAIFNGQRAAVAANVTRSSDGTVSLFKSQGDALAAFSGPVGFNIGQRNNLRGPGFFWVDAGLGKTFPLVADRVKLKFRADAFNALNHPNFSNPSTNDITSGNFGQITGTAGENSTVDATGSNTARVLQFALRVEF